MTQPGRGRLAGENVDDAAEQHRLGELRAGQQQIGAGENPAQPRLLAEQLKDARIEAKQGHADQGSRVGGTDDRSNPHSNQGSSRRYSVRRHFAQLIRRPPSGGRKLSSKISAADGRLLNLKSSAIWSIERSRRAGSMPPMPLRLHFAGEDVVVNQGAQAFQFELARSVVHPADHLVRRALRAPGWPDGCRRSPRAGSLSPPRAARQRMPD